MKITREIDMLRLLTDESGATTFEYGLIAALVVIAAIGCLAPR
jgi:Flp pilus assembly pilin Flp